MFPATARGALAIALIASAIGTAHAAGKTATVRGAEAVNVRRAPSPDSPAFATLAKGTGVSVDKVVGTWALITLPGGRQGYVKAVFLELPPGVEVEAVETAAASPTAAAGAPTATSANVAAASPAIEGEARTRDALEREMAHLRERMAALESAVVAAPGATPPVHDDANRPPPAREAVRREATAGVLLPTPVQAPDTLEIGPSLALAGVGLVIGFLIGAAYGRRQERNRRSRVRF
jgi:hypothetical protein